MTQRRIALLLLPLAFWSIIPLYWQRVHTPQERLCGMLAVLTALAFVHLHRVSGPTRPSLLVPSLLVLSYGLCIVLLPKVLAVPIALIAIAACLSAITYGSPVHVGLYGLLFLSLPVLSRAQFYFGYPLRVLVGALATPMIRLSGLAVVQEGTVLNLGGELVVIDAPCSGIKMLWAGFYLTFTLACLYRLSAVQTLMYAVGTLVIVLVGNALRTASLFQLETVTIDFPAWMHDAVGLVVFGMTAAGVLLLFRAIARRDVCVT